MKKRTESAILQQKITRHISNTMGTKRPVFSYWYVGITNNISRRKGEHKARKFMMKHFFYVKSSSVQLASEIETYFSEVKGTSNFSHKGGAKLDSVNIYVFRFSKSTGLAGLGEFSSAEEFRDWLFS